MSFILDALRKSETDRQRQSTPGIGDVPNRAGSGHTPRWIWALAGLLAVNAVVLFALWLRPAPGEDVAVSAPLPTTEKLPAGGPSFSQVVSDARDTRPASIEQAEPPQASAASSADGAVQTASTPVSPPPSRAGTAKPESLATFDELRVDGTMQLPDLHLDIHVYADKPADRFVFVNMTKYREQDKLSEGPVVKEISADGVILEHQGIRFLLPRD